MPGRYKNESKYCSFFDVDAQAELRRLPLSSVSICPRVGEHVQLRTDREHGGGVYLVVGVRQVLIDCGPKPERGATMEALVIELKPQHAIELDKPDIAAEVLVEELESIPLPSEPLPN
ncbi:MAG: hypothetical protein ACJ74Z_19645 [Bryobacteraceae bacterium]